MVTKRTSAYVFTADPLSCDSMQQINGVQATIRAVNAYHKLVGNPCRLRVTLKGRLGKNNPAAAKYRYATRPYPWSNPYRTISIADAQRIDVYVHSR